jgi:hypothetical protein
MNILEKKYQRSSHWPSIYLSIQSFHLFFYFLVWRKPPQRSILSATARALRPESFAVHAGRAVDALEQPGRAGGANNARAALRGRTFKRLMDQTNRKP